MIEAFQHVCITCRDIETSSVSMKILASRWLSLFANSTKMRLRKRWACQQATSRCCTWPHRMRPATSSLTWSNG